MYFDFLDFQKLALSLNSIDKNHVELANQYNILFNTAQANRKALINSWNRFGILPLSQDAKYVNGSGTASIKGAIDAMPVYRFDQDVPVSATKDANGDWKLSATCRPGVYNSGTINFGPAETMINSADSDMDYVRQHVIKTKTVVSAKCPFEGTSFAEAKKLNNNTDIARSTGEDITDKGRVPKAYTTCPGCGKEITLGNNIDRSTEEPNWKKAKHEKVQKTVTVYTCDDELANKIENG